MDAPRKDATLALLRQVVDDTAMVHTPDGWFCNADNTECGATVDSLCACCAGAMFTLVDARSTAGGDGEPV